MRNADANAKTDPATPPPRTMCLDKDGKPQVLQAGENIFYHEARQDPVTGRLVCVLCKAVM